MGAQSQSRGFRVHAKRTRRVGRKGADGSRKFLPLRKFVRILGERNTSWSYAFEWVVLQVASVGLRVQVGFQMEIVVVLRDHFELDPGGT